MPVAACNKNRSVIGVDAAIRCIGSARLVVGHERASATNNRLRLLQHREQPHLHRGIESTVTVMRHAHA